MNFRTTIIGAAAILLTACKTYISTDLYSSDLIAATEGETLTAPLVIGTQTSGECAADASKLLASLQIQMPEAEFVGCTQVDYDDIAQFRVQAAIVDQRDNPRAAFNAPFAIGVSRQGGEIDVAFLSNDLRVRQLWDSLPEDVRGYSRFSFEPVLSATLTNDLRTEIEVLTDDVFADGTPYPDEGQHIMPRRDQIEIRLSDVSNAAFGNTQSAVTILRMKMPDGS